MEYFLYPFAGLAAAFLGALPPGAVNLSVVYTTLNQGARAAIPVIVTAALGEVVLSYFALHCAMAVDEYIQQNVYVQYLVAGVLIAAGLFLFLKKPSQDTIKVPKKNSGFLKGLLLSILNPPVLVFWLVAFTFLAANTSLMLEMGLLQLVVLFFLGVVVGKVLALWLYLQLSKRIANRASNITTQINRGISLLLIVIGVVQLGELIF